MNVLICGSHGFIGSYIFEKLKNHISNIYVFNRSYANSQKPWEFVFDSGKGLKGLCSIKELNACILCVGFSPAGLFPNEISDKCIDSNVGYVKNIIKFITKNFGAIPIINLSSLSVYKQSGKEIISENSLLNYENCYSLCKIESENLLNSWNEKIFNLRISAIYDSKMKAVRYQKLLYTWINNAICNRKLICCSNALSCNRNYLYIDDLTSLILDILHNNNYGTYNIASSDTLPIYEMAKKIIKVFNSKSPIVFDTSLKMMENYKDISIKRAKEKLNFNPVHTFDKGIEKIRLLAEVKYGMQSL